MTKIADGECFAILAPPKPEPVLREAWVVWDADGYETVWCVEKDAADRARHFRGVYARAAVMSDGSPVPGENVWVAAHVADNQINHWKAKAEVLQASLEEARQQRDDASVAVEALQAEVDRMKPVVDNAVIWERRYEAMEANCKGWIRRCDKAEADLAAARAEVGE